MDGVFTQNGRINTKYMKEYKSTIPEITLKYKSGDTKKVKVNSSKDAADYMRELYDIDTIEITESAIVLFLNRANNSIGWYKVSQGGINGTVIDIKLIIATALKCASSGIILSHNHPSGTLIPSEEDKKLTKKLNEACKILDIFLLDHVIITESGHYSFADDGLLFE